MELKSYQQEVLNDLASFMEQLNKDNNLSRAYSNFWLQKGINVNTLDCDALRPYDNTIKGVPRVMFKVPTAGGKTFIACNALRTIFDHSLSDAPQVVVWFVPSDPILVQTYRNLSNPQHPYRQKIDTLFNHAVQVVDKESALSGQGIRPNQIQNQLTIFVLSVQSFASNNKDGRRVYRENSSLAEYSNVFGKDNKVDGADETSLIQTIAHLNPVVIIDESHNFEANLRLDMLNNINPRFILDLTATPRKKSNIISFVDAMSLKKANMVKLPVILYNRNSTEEVIIDAIQMQRNLEKRAVEMEKNGGAYIRPIVLFQAQPKNDKDTITFDKVKDNLVKIGIPESHIAIKTAEKNELKNIDLMSRDCEIRYIITVNALKEGWDCPFAYILASLANKNSRVDVEQILGRILRLPYTSHHTDEFLNFSYVFTSSSNFRETVESVIQSLHNAGFSQKDYRLAENSVLSDNSVNTPTQTPIFDQPNTSSADATSQITTNDKTVESDSSQNEFAIDIEQVKKATSSNNENDNKHVEYMLSKAQQQNVDYEKANAEENFCAEIPNEIRDKVKTYRIKDDFADLAKKIKLPVFQKKIKSNSLFSMGDYVNVSKTMLAEEFLLDNADSNVDFTRTEQETVKIDLEKRADNEYVPKQSSFNNQQVTMLREMFVGYNVEVKREQLAGKIAKQLNFDEIHEPHITNYVKKVLNNLSDEILEDLYDHDIVAVKAFRSKIKSLILEHQKKKFKEWMDVGLIKCNPQYEFDESITLGRSVVGLSKGLYTDEGDMNDFEYRVISQVANLDNVIFWHRNPERGKGFCLNGFVNHYPDFIVYLKSGKIVLVETKGDDRDNSDSRDKIELGRYWANKAGDDYRYFMVFENVKLDNAISVQELINYLGQM